MRRTLTLPLTRRFKLLLATKKNIHPVPCEQRSRPGQSHRREVTMRGALVGVHHLRNVFRRRKRSAAYAHTLVRRGPLKRQQLKMFIIDTPLGPPEIITLRSRDILARFKRGQQTMQLYFKL